MFGGRSGRTAIRTDLSQSSSLWNSVGPSGSSSSSPEPARRCPSTAYTAAIRGMLARLLQLRAKAQARTGQLLPLIFFLEDCLDGFWVDCVLECKRVGSHVADPAPIAVFSRYWRATTGRLDGGALVPTLLAYECDETRVRAMARGQSLRRLNVAESAANARRSPHSMVRMSTASTNCCSRRRSATMNCCIATAGPGSTMSRLAMAGRCR